MVSDGLTKREEQILNLLGEGLTDREIGQQLGIKNSTVRTHTYRIYDKIQVRNRSEAAIYVMKGKVEEACAEREKFIKMIVDAQPELSALLFYQSRSIELLKALAAIDE